MNVSVSPGQQLSARGVQRDRLGSSFLNHSVGKFIVRILIHILIQGLGIWEKLWMTDKTKTSL